MQMGFPLLRIFGYKGFFLLMKSFFAYRKVIWSTGRKKKDNRGVVD